MNKYEQLIEHIINDETDKARELFHNIVVEKSRDIYESLIDEEELNEVGGNEVEDLVDEVTIDEEGMYEDEDEDTDMDMDADEADMDVDSEFDYDDSGELDDHEEDHDGIEDRVMDLESALDELKAEFDELMAGEEAEEENFPGIHGDDDMSDEMTDDGDAGEEFDPEMVREYVEKVGETNQKSEGGEVGTGKRASVNAKSIVAGKNDMGGSAKNLVRSDTGEDVSAEKPKAKVPHADKFENVPGAKAGDAFDKKETSWEGNKKPEGQTTKGKMPVQSKSILKKA